MRINYWLERGSISTRGIWLFHIAPPCYLCTIRTEKAKKRPVFGRERIGWINPPFKR